MRWAVVLLTLPVLLACSAVGFQPAECSVLSPDNRGWLHDQLYRDFLRGTHSGDCFEFRGVVSQSIDGGYVVDTEGYGTGFPGDVFVRWEGDYRFVEGDLVVVTGAVADPLTFETVLGAQRTIPAFYGSDMGDLLERARPTREAIAATERAENRTKWDQMTAEALQEVQPCDRPWHIIHELEGSGDDYEVDKLELDFVAGPVPNLIVIRANTIPHIVAEGYYTLRPLQSHLDVKYGQVTARWVGDCRFMDIEVNEGAGPTPDPNAPRPTYTPRPAP